MSDKHVSTKNETLPRKKKRTKRKANSPLTKENNNSVHDISGYSEHDNKSSKVKAVNCTQQSNIPVGSIPNQVFPFSFNPHTYQPIQMMSSQPTIFGGQYAGPIQPPTTQMYNSGQFCSPTVSPGINPQQQQLFPNQTAEQPKWVTDLMDEMKQIKTSSSKIDNIEKTVNLIHLKVSDLETKVNTMETRMNEVEKSCSFMSSTNDEQKSDIEQSKSDIKTLHNACETLQKKFTCQNNKSCKIDERISDLESRSMRENLMFYGIREEDEENCEAQVKQLMGEKLQVTNPDKIEFDRVHRVGKKSDTSIRPIVAKFHHYREREMVRQKGIEHSETLKAEKQGVGIQWPKDVREARKSLYPIMQEERRKGNTVKMIKDKLYINGSLYSGPTQSVN